MQAKAIDSCLENLAALAMPVCPICTGSLRPGAIPSHPFCTGLLFLELNQNIQIHNHINSCYPPHSSQTLPNSPFKKLYTLIARGEIKAEPFSTAKYSSLVFLRK